MLLCCKVKVNNAIQDSDSGRMFGYAHVKVEENEDEDEAFLKQASLRIIRALPVVTPFNDVTLTVTEVLH